jgi:protein gp37
LEDVMATWNLWHGCRKISPGCLNCYVYREDAHYGRDSGSVYKTQSFDLPVRKDRRGAFKVPSGETVFTCFTSDYFLEEADAWRGESWEMIRARPDLDFFIITKRIARFCDTLPGDWGAGYDNVTVYSTVENQAMADSRLPILLTAPLRHKGIACEPLLERLDLSRYLGPAIERVVAGGESGLDARPCHYDWVLGLRSQCLRAGVPFTFKQTGRLFFKDGKRYIIKRRFQHDQARRAGIDT